MSPCLIEFPVITFFFPTIPTAKPAKSKESPVYIPGISAVSPPDKEQPAILHPFAMPDSICLYFFSTTFGIAI